MWFVRTPGFNAATNKQQSPQSTTARETHYYYIASLAAAVTREIIHYPPTEKLTGASSDWSANESEYISRLPDAME